MAAHNELGKTGEEVAKQFLIDKGYKILETNWKSGKYEIDIIAQKYDFLSIIEVKTRSTDYFGFPEKFLTPKQMQRLIYAAHNYTEQKNLDIGIRYECLALTKQNDGGFHVEHLEEAFDSYTVFELQKNYAGSTYKMSVRNRKW
ncbi:MAG: YraN family protein [Prevotellaceae bacterium]|nr:YraN family protein [Prevotellaceae bacterium]